MCKLEDIDDEETSDEENGPRGQAELQKVDELHNL